MTGEIAIGVERLQERTQKVRKAMQASGLDALVICANPTRLGCGSNAGSLRYLTNWTSPFDSTVLVLPLAADPVLIVGSPLDQDRVVNQVLTWVRDTRVDSLNKGAVAREIILERCGSAAKVGLVGRTVMPGPEYLALTEGATQASFADADRLVQALRLVKEAEEIELHRKAAAISDAMHEGLATRARSDDVWEWELRSAMEQAAVERRVEYGHCWLGIGPMAGDTQTYFSWENRRKLQVGDQIFSGTYVIFDGYWGHSIRGGFKGKPSAKFLQAYDILTQALEAGTTMLKPGTPVVDVARAITAAVQRHTPGIDGVWMRSGHGLGLDYAEPLVSDCFPYLKAWGSSGREPDTTLLLQPGMVLELHPSLKAPDLGCNNGALGDMVLITDSGYETLTQFPREPFQV